MQINRLFEIVYILLEQRIVTAKQLSQQFNVSQRTIYRDIDTLSLSGIPIYTEKGKGGGITILPEFILNKSAFNEQEQHDILSALKTLSSVSSLETEKVLNKLSALFKRNVTDWLQVDFSDWAFARNSYFDNFKTAILQHRLTEFDYYNTGGEKTRRQVEPIQLSFKHKAWYLKGFCLLRQDMRLFRLTRIKNLIVTDKLFHDRDLEPIRFETTGEHYKNRNLVDLKLKINPEAAHRVFDDFDDKLVIKQQDGSFLISVTWPEDYWVYGFILSYGEQIEVLEPQHIRETIKNKISIIEKIYS